MITIIKDYDGSSVDVRRKEIMCLSGDDKPTDVANGSVCLEIDTGKLFVYDEEGENWYNQDGSGIGGGGAE